MFKRILKILGVCMAIFVGVCGLGVGIYALKGGFKDVEINILRLYVDDTTKADKTIYTLNDFTTRINYEPLNATSTDLEVVIQDPMRIVENGNLVKEGILKNVPSTIKAGEDFKIQINKDANGNNYGGAVTLTFRPKGNDKAITEFKLKVVVDVAIPNNSLYFAGNNGDSYSTVYGKTITMGISTNEQYIYLKSNLVNAFYLEAENKNLKQAQISYVYRNLKGDLVEQKTFTNLGYDRIYNATDKVYNYYFKVPVTPRESGTIVMSAKMHKTYEIEQEYIANDFDNITEPTANNPEAQVKLDKYNEFINKYIAYFDTTDESYEFFRNYMRNDGTVVLPYRAVAASRNYIWQTTTSTINISAVNLSDIYSTDVAQEFKVFSKETYTIDNMIDKFDLDITLSEDNVAQVSKEKANLFSTLQVLPYIYLEKSEYINTKDTLWQNYGIVLGVTDFTSAGKPIVSDTPITIENVESDEWIGFLIALSGKSNYKEYITSELKNDAENKVWTLGFNTPLTQNSTETSIKSATKALFLQFQVTGRNLDTNEKIVKNAYTRIYIDYDEYQYKDQNSAKISFSTNLKRMSINKNVQNATNYDYASELNIQKINVSLKDSINNYDTVQYKNVMYFVEKNSNRIDNGGGAKLATIGSYKFRYMNTGINGASTSIKRFNSEEDLIGERLLNYGTITDPDYRLYAINASNEPARVFAVVYLSDENGKPIDVNGRPITINESIEGGEETELVVFAITDITEAGMASVTIDNFVNNINYYTISQIGYDINDEQDTDEDGEVDTTITYSVAEGQWVKRNKVDEYIDAETGLSFSEEKLRELQNFLQLKMLYRNRITLYATNFELDESGAISSVDTTNTTLLMDVKDFYGKTIKDKAYSINTYQNKQLALNNMLKNFVSDYYLNILSTNSTPVQNTEIIYSDPTNENSSVVSIKFDLVAEGKKTSTDDYIYIKAREGVANSLDFNRKDYVSWEVNKLSVEDIDLFKLGKDDRITDLNTYNKLYSNYSTNPKAGQLFGNVEFTDSFSFTPYYLYEYYKNDGLGFVKDSTDDNVYFVVKTNLYGNYDNGTGVNLDIVDMSQAQYDRTSEVETTPNMDLFANIYDYIEYYTKNTMTMSVSYQNASGMAQLKQDLYFPSEGNYILVGNKKFEKKSGNVMIDGVSYTKYITAGGRNYGITTSEDERNFRGEEVVIIKSGEYYPIIKNYTTANGNPVVIICDAEFEIENSVDVTDTNSGVIYNISDRSTGRYRTAIVSKITTINGSAYNVNDYIDEGNADNTYTALKKEQLKKDGIDSTFVTNATVKFIKGGTLKDNNGNEIFVKDENGKYYYNTTTQNYEICPDDTSKELRYSKKGIMAYLMITYNFFGLNGSEGKPITKVIAYELNQEPVTLVATGNVLGSAGGVVLKDQSELTESLIITAGKTTSFKLSNVSSSSSISSNNTISIVGASYEKNFFFHCKFTISGGAGSASGIRFKQNNKDVYEMTISSLDETINLYVPNRYSTATANVVITYTDENGTQVDRILRLTINPNYTFDTKSGQGISIIDNKYIISLDQDREYGIAEDLVNKYFVLLDNIKTNNQNLHIELTNLDESNKYASAVGDKLIIGKSYAYVNNNTLVRDSAEFKIIIVDGDTRIEVTNTLYININPKYTIDMNRLQGDIVYGTNVITANYIDIYEGSVRNSDTLVNSVRFDSIASEIGLKLYRGNTLLADNKVVSDNMYTTFTNVEFKIAYIEGLNNNITHPFTLNVIGFEKYYSYAGKFVDGIDNSYESIKTIADKTFPNSITIAVRKDETINLNRYFRTFTINNGGSVDIYPLLKWVDDDGNANYENVIGNNNYRTFTLCYAVLPSGTANYVVLAEDTNITINIQLLELFYKTAGFADEDYNTLVADASYVVNNNISIATTNDTMDIANYIRGYVNNGTGTVKIVLLDDANNIVTMPVSTTSEGKTYKIAYVLSDGLDAIDTGYTVTLSKSE